MKTLKLFTTTVLVLFALQMNAQIRPGVKTSKGVKNNTKIKVDKPNPQMMNQDLNFYQIKYNTRNNIRCYSISTTINAVDDRDRNFAGFGNALMDIKDKGFVVDRVSYQGKSGATNNASIAVNTVSDLGTKIDKNNILVDFYRGSLDSRSFLLKDVKIIRSKHHILITGSAKVRGTSFSVSIAILEGDCLI